mmetsp:Transcript_18619/g.61161  ORF Transcript_18619/g.61161 Transcript_18619/m.61161 type:complete len:81 (-) Transcript_18619:947-1189(-)
MTRRRLRLHSAKRPRQSASGSAVSSIHHFQDAPTRYLTYACGKGGATEQNEIQLEMHASLLFLINFSCAAEYTRSSFTIK